MKFKVPKKEKSAGRGLDYWGKLFTVALRRMKLYDADAVNEPIVIGIVGQLVEDLDRVNWDEMKRRKPVTPTQKELLSTSRQRKASVLYDTPELFDLLDNGETKDEDRGSLNGEGIWDKEEVKFDGNCIPGGDSGCTNLTNFSYKQTPSHKSTKQQQQIESSSQPGGKQKLQDEEEKMRTYVRKFVSLSSVFILSSIIILML